jgi:hypothetical protein
MDYDFITDLEDTLSHFPGLDDLTRRYCNPAGDTGLLVITLENGRKYTLSFEPV